MSVGPLGKRLSPGDAVGDWIVVAPDPISHDAYRVRKSKGEREEGLLELFHETPNDEVRQHMAEKLEQLESIRDKRVPRLLDGDMESDLAYLVSEAPPRGRLSAKMQGFLATELSPPDLAASILRALDLLHSAGLCHGDIRPDTLGLRTDGTIELCGLRSILDAGSITLVYGDRVHPSVSYTPPEALNPGRTDLRPADIYALGVILYEALTRQVAYDLTPTKGAKAAAMKVLLAKRSQACLDPGEAAGPEFRKLVMGLTAKSADERPNVTEALGSLHLESDVPIPAPPPPPKVVEAFEPQAPAHDPLGLFDLEIALPPRATELPALKRPGQGASLPESTALTLFLLISVGLGFLVYLVS